ncbi:hypothetical protein [Streptomyces platensis]|uniref:hypothetical protein n=1 Tax=Streptomyces platensis TaxID=58346 RepID=UPI0036B760BF
MSFVPGTPRERAGTLLAVLPVAAALVTLGTVLGVHSWTAAGMLVMGFLVSYAGVGASRLDGLSGGFQSFYILAFRPAHGTTWGARSSRSATPGCHVREPGRSGGRRA